MADPAERPMTREEFLEWAQHQEIPYEWVDGKPRPKYPDDGTPYGMAGGTLDHHTIMGNAYAALRSRKPASCRAAVDGRVRVGDGTSRLPDAMLLCGRIEKGQLETDSPVVIVEVISPSTANADRGEKLEAYRSIATAREIWLVESERRRVTVWRRADSRWIVEDVIGDGLIESDVLTSPVPLAELYEDVEV